MIFRKIINLVPTIGGAIADLLNLDNEVNDNQSIRKYSFFLGDDPRYPVCDCIDITRTGELYKLCNRTTAPICVSMHAINGNDPSTITIPSSGSLKLNDLFKRCAQHDVDSFTITTEDKSLSSNKLFEGSEPFTISAYGSVIVNAQEPKFIGVYTSAKLTATDITITQIDKAGAGEIVSLYLTPTGSNRVFSIIDVDMDKDETSITLPHNLVLQDGESVHVSVTINYAVANYEEYMQRNNERYGVSLMTKEEITMLEKLSPVNRLQ